MKIKHPILLFTLFLSLQLSAKDTLRYIVTVRNITSFSAPDRTSEILPNSLEFGSLVLPTRIIHNDYDFNYLEINIDGRQLYLPEEMCILLDTDAEDTILRYQSQKLHPEQYIPEDLAALNKSLTLDGKEVSVRRQLHEDLKRIIEHGQREGFFLKVAGGYADLDQRISEYEKAIQDDPKQSYVRPPLESDYGSALVVDFTDTIVGTHYKKYFQTYKLWQWLSDNAAEYNFVPTEYTYKYLYSSSSVVADGSLRWKYRIVQIMDTYRLRLYTGKPTPYYSFLWIHNNELSAGRTLAYAHDKYGANSVSLINGGKRFITVNYNGKKYPIDPNRIFTDKGVDRHLQKMYRTTRSPYAREIKNRMKEFRELLIKQLDWSKSKYLIALHSSLKDSDFSVEDFSNKIKYQCFKNPQENPKNFIFVTRQKDFTALSKMGFNTVYQKKIDDDGSLSVYAHFHKLPYINIEVVEGDERYQKKMLDAVISHIIKSESKGGSQ